MHGPVNDDVFFHVARTRRETSAGAVDLPILYRDASNVVAFFRARALTVSNLLKEVASMPLEPALVFGDDAIVALSFYEYRRTSVGSYNEVGFAVPVLRAGEPRPRLGAADLFLPPRIRSIAALVVDLPVTTPLANAAGREIWGYPKFVTRIPFHLRGRVFDAEVCDPTHPASIVRLAGKIGRGLPVPPLGLMTYTFRQGELVRTHVDVRGLVFASGGGSMRLEIGHSHHPMAEHLRGLGLHGARPRFVLRTHRFQSKLYEGARVA